MKGAKIFLPVAVLLLACSLTISSPDNQYYCGSDWDEPNDSPAQATWLAWRYNIQNGKICPPGDVDWFYINETIPGEFRIYLTMPASDVNYDLVLYNSSLNEVASSHRGPGESEFIKYHVSSYSTGIYYIKVYGVAGSYHATYDYDFVVLYLPDCYLKSPNGGENWVVGSTQTITWEAFGVVGNVKLEYSTNNGANWLTIIASTENVSSYLWIIPNTPSNSCLVRISEASDGDPFDISNSSFIISIGPGYGYYIFDGHDFNGNGISDISVWRPADGMWYIKDIATHQWGMAGDIPCNGDYNGNGITDVAVWRPAEGMWYLKNIGGYKWGTSGDIPVPGKYNVGPTTDIAVWRPSTGMWYVKDIGAWQWGISGDIPVPSDYNGDWITDIAVWRPSDGMWYIRNIGAYQWGTAGDIPVPADYNGDGITDIAVWRPSDGMWYIWYMGGGTAAIQWGTLGDIPVPGDYNGDATTEIVVWRPSDGLWYIYGNGTSQWGTAGDIPLVR